MTTYAQEPKLDDTRYGVVITLVDDDGSYDEKVAKQELHLLPATLTNINEVYDAAQALFDEQLEEGKGPVKAFVCEVFIKDVIELED